jgi:hypothetical protein
MKSKTGATGGGSPGWRYHVPDHHQLVMLLGRAEVTGEDGLEPAAVAAAPRETIAAKLGAVLHFLAAVVLLLTGGLVLSVAGGLVLTGRLIGRFLLRRNGRVGQPRKADGRRPARKKAA